MSSVPIRNRAPLDSIPLAAARTEEETMLAVPATPGSMRRPLNQHAPQSAETARGLVQRNATTATPSLGSRSTGARQLAQSSAGSCAPGAARPLRSLLSDSGRL